jgi:hypothetical protein
MINEQICLLSVLNLHSVGISLARGKCERGDRLEWDLILMVDAARLWLWGSPGGC